MMKLGEFLVTQGKITNRDLERTLVAKAEMGGMFGQVLVKLGLVSELDVAKALTELLQLPLLADKAFDEHGHLGTSIVHHRTRDRFEDFAAARRGAGNTQVSQDKAPWGRARRG